MSRAINTSLATIQFQVNARQANAAMQALQEASNDLNRAIDSVNRNIANLGKDVPKDNPQLLNYQSQLAGLKKDLKDVEKAQRDFLKGAKAADQLWKAASEGTIESLSFRSIKTGINGLKKRQEGLSPGDAQDMKDWRIIKDVIDEADRVVKQAGADVQNVVQTIREGGKVSEQTMRQTISTLKELKGSVDETDADFRTYGNDLTFMEAKLQEFSDAQRRARGEIVDANDARREMNKLTAEGAAAAQREAEAAERKIAALHGEREELMAQREQIKQNIAATQEQIDKNHELIEEKHRQLAADEHAHNVIQDANHAHIEGLKTQAEAERKLANEKSDAAETHRRAAELQAQTTEQLTEKVTELQGKLAALHAEPVKPKVDSSEIDALNTKLQEAQTLLDQKTTAANTAFNNYLDARKPKRKDILEYSDEFIEKYGLQGRTFSHITAADNFRFPFNMNLSQVRDAATDPESEWEIAGPQAKKILSDYEWFKEQIGKVADQIHEQYLKLAKANAEGVDVEQLKTVANNIKRLEELKAKMAQVAEMPADDYDFYLGGDQFRSQFGDIDKTIKNTSKNIDNAIQKAIDQRFDYHDKKHAIEIQEAKEVSELADKEKEAAKIAVDGIKAEIEAKKQNVGATKAESNQQSEEELRLKDELKTAQGKLAESKQRENDEQQEYVKLQGEAIEQGNKAAAAETKLADAQSEATQKQAEFNQKQQEGLDNINQMAEGNKALQTTLEGQEQQLKDNSDAVRKNAEETTAAEQEKAQTRQLSIKRMEEMLAKLKEEYYTEELTAEKREEHKQKIKELDEALRLAKGEWMSYGDAMKYASSIGSEGFMATDEQTKMATDALTRHREELIKTIQQKEADSQATSAERAELEQLDQALTKIKTGFASADEVMTRWAEHMNAGKTASEGVAQTLDEKLAGATSSWDAKIAAETSYLEDCNKELDRYEQELQELSEELKGLEQKHSNRSWLWKKTHARQYQREESRIEWLREDTTSGNTFDEEGNIKRATTKGLVDEMRYYKQDAQERLAQLKQLKAEELGLTESEVDAEEKKADAKKLTNEQMQEGIKLLEEEYAKTEHTTEEGIKKRQQLRETIDQMNQELKESTGEWMKLADAEKLAEQAGKDTFLNKEGKGFIASPEEIQKATQALERRRDALIKNMKTSGEATKEQERELADLTKKIKDLKFEQDNLNMSQEKMQMLMKQPANAVSLDELRAAIKRADAELKRMEGSLGQNNDQYKVFAEQVRNAKNMLKEMEGQAKASATAWEKAWSRLKTYVVMYMGFNAVWQKMVGTADDLMQLSDKMGEVRKTTGFTADEVGRLSDSLKKLDTRTTITGLLDLSVAAGQLGLKTQEDVEGFTIAANKLMVALPEMGKEGATEMLKVALATGEIDKIRKQMEQGIIDGSSATAVAMEKVGSTIDRLRATSAATAPAITDFVKRVGAVGAQSGISIDQVAALGSTVDALGMRVEMSATALSRMIPAIKNNAFDVAKAIGVTPNTLRDLFETGRGMEAILLIFQKIKDSGMGADDIDKMLGMGNMKEVMKELNQQGARAGIVFAGLSQNVDVLREHLGTAAQAYEENIAIQQEYNKMNETTAAKWERLKNQLEETFVGDRTQRWLGGLIDMMRQLVNIISGNVEPALKSLNIAVWTAIAYFSVWRMGIGKLVVEGFGLLIRGLVALKNATLAVVTAQGRTGLMASISKAIGVTRMYIAANLTLAFSHDQEAKAAARATLANNALAKSMNANVILAVIAAVATLIWMLRDWNERAKEAAREAAKFHAELDKETKKVDNLTDSIGKARAKTEDANKEVEKSKKALDEVKKSTDGTKESTDKLTKAESDLIEKEEIRNKAMAEHKRLIEQFNSEYGKYLGFMLSEVSSNIELANARQLVNDKLRETITLKRKEAALTRVENEMGEDRDDAYASLWSAVRYSATSTNRGKTVQDPTKAAKVMTALTKAAQDANHDRKSFEDAAKKIFQENKIAWRGNSVLSNALSYYDEVAKIREKTVEIEQQFTAEESANREQSQKDLKLQYAAAADNYTDLYQKYTNATGKAKQKAAADLLRQQDTINEMVNNASNYFDVSDAGEKASYDSFIKNSEARIKMMAETRKKLLKEAGNAYTSRKTVSGGTTTSIKENPWGGNAPAESTDYATWDVNELVARRNQMDKFKNVLKPDTDIRAVLAEDKALMKALDNGLKEDWKSVLGWYNTERKKIQEELKSERFSTNEGHWRDEKQGRSRKNHFRESDYALAELDRYYSKRKEELEKARIEENMSEELFNRQAELLEQEHLERRSKLRETFTAGNTKEEKEMVKQFRDWWSKLEKEGKLDEVPWATVESEWAKALASEIGRNNLKAQQDLTQMQQITVKHLNKIADIIAKERPYDGIVDNLRKNLTEMDILFADMEKKGATDPATLVKEQNTRLQFLLGEAETAYQSSIDDVLKRMADAGMTAWAEEISKSDAMKNALMAQLQTAYDEIQNTIKKEASQIKKHTDIWWNDLMPGQDTSRKGGFEKMLSRLGLQEDQVKRANALIGAGAASERVADKLAIKQMQIRLQMQQVYYQKMRQMWDDRIRSLREQGKEIDAQHAEISKQLSLSEEQKKLDEQRVAIANQLEESQNRLYQELRSWADLLTSSLQSVMEASHAGDREYYNERAKLDLTGRGGPGAGMYIVIEDEGTSDATAHYEYLDERAALERQREIENQNAVADAWKKVFDDLNQKMSDTITDQLNAMLQNQSIDANTQAVIANTEALWASIGSKNGETGGNATEALSQSMVDKMEATSGSEGGFNIGAEKEAYYSGGGELSPAAQQQIADQNAVTENFISNKQEEVQTEQQADKKMATGSQSMFAKMTQAANLYGIAYQAMSNDNLSTEQKFQMIAVQTAGQAAISALTATMSASTASVAGQAPAVASRTFLELGPIAGPAALAAITALLGGLMGIAVSKIAKGKSEIAQVTGASINAGRMATGMLTYASGNINELSDPTSLTVGRSYNVDGADGKTYRAKYMGVGAKTHITNGPEFHLVGEAGREAIIDAHTTRNIQLNEPEIWRSIQTLYNGGSLRHTATRRGRGVRAFADGNLDDFEDVMSGSAGDSGMDFGSDMLAGFQNSLDRNSEVMERVLQQGIHAYFDVYGKGGLVDSYDTGKKTVQRHGERY